MITIATCGWAAPIDNDDDVDNDDEDGRYKDSTSFSSNHFKFRTINSGKNDAIK